jgi:hypothetical protein
LGTRVAKHLSSAATGQVHVEQHHVGPLLLDDPHGRLDVFGLADDLDGVAELCAHSAAEHPVIVDQHDAYDAWCGRPSGAAGGLG